MDVFTNNLKSPEWWTEQIATDLYFLCRCIMQTLEDPTPGYKDLYRPTHGTICKFVQSYATPGNKLLILTPRGWVKSYVVTIAWSLQQMFRNWLEGKHVLQIISNATLPNAKEFLAKIKYNLQYNDILRGLLSRFLPKDLENVKGSNKWTLDEIQLNGCRIETGSAEGNLVSRHYGIMINDDLVNRENSKNAEQILKVIDWWQLSQSLLNPNGIEINIGTRWNYDDLYGHIIAQFIKPEKDYYKGKPIVEVHNGKYHLLQMDCWADPDNETGSTFPTLFPESKLKQIFLEQGDRAYGQYRNDPLARGKNPIKREWFRRYHPDSEPSQRITALLVDPSGKARETSDDTGLVVIDFCSDRKGYLKIGEKKRITDMTLGEYIITLALRYHPDFIGMEDVKFKTMIDILELLIPQKLRERVDGKFVIPSEEHDYIRSLPYLLRELKPGGRDKDTRIRNLTGRIESGDFVFPMSGTEQLEEQLIRFPTSSKKDIADAFAYALDVMHFPKVTDPPKLLVVPAHLKMTQEERIEKEWDEMRGEAYVDGQPTEYDDIY